MENCKKMGIRTGFLILMVLIALIGCGQVQKVPLSRCAQLRGIPGPADLAVEQRSAFGGDRLIIASQARRGSDPEGEYLEQGRMLFVPLSGSNRNDVLEFSFSGRDEYPFHPEGMDVVDSGGSHFLIVANHARKDQHAIEVFRIERTSLNFITRYRHEFFEYPVDVVALGSEEFYVLNRRSASGLQNIAMSSVFLGSGSLVYVNGNQFFRVLSNLKDPSSISLSPDQSKIWINVAGSSSIRIYQRGSGPDLQPVASVGLPSTPGRGAFLDSSRYLVTGIPSGWDLSRHESNPANLASSQVFSLATSNGSLALAYQDQGEEISGAYGIAVRSNQLFLGPRYDDYVLACTYP
ncbi:MAG: hypothetical protein KDK25_10610 [Leptospiraceae bacterium]|nr:hypothetical protein [Leptospiraceae bacterium]